MGETPARDFFQKQPIIRGLPGMHDNEKGGVLKGGGRPPKGDTKAVTGLKRPPEHKNRLLDQNLEGGAGKRINQNKKKNG